MANRPHVVHLRDTDMNGITRTLCRAQRIKGVKRTMTDKASEVTCRTCVGAMRRKQAPRLQYFGFAAGG